ncbi:uncharacterized protein LOC125577967 [Brassica napus]|uniref:uncharacterized protein LOC125577967 n=1 Tax=Brassica napus TaxID=3708 RepID=UPI002078A28D|nr:uncharacterized protein LOC125577967 [Brassica napus]
MLSRETRAPFCRVVGYIFGLEYEYVKKPLYIVRLESESDFQLPIGTRLPLIHDESVEYIDEEDLFKIFHDPAKTGDVFDDEEEEEVNDCQSTTTKKRRRMSTNEQEIINSNHYDGSSQFSEPNLGAQGLIDVVPNLFPSQASMMYNQQQLDQPNQMGFFPTLPPSLAPVTPMMYNQQLGFRSSQVTEPNLGTEVPTMLVGQHNLRQSFGMRQQPFLNAAAPMVYNPPHQFMRREINQPNNMGVFPNPFTVQAPTMYNQRYGSQITEPNLGAQVSTMFLDQNNPNQPFGMCQQPSQSAAAPVMYNQQLQSMRPVTNQQNQMSSMRMFSAGQSSYCGRGSHGLGRGGRD